MDLTDLTETLFFVSRLSQFVSVIFLVWSQTEAVTNKVLVRVQLASCAAIIDFLSVLKLQLVDSSREHRD